MIFFIVDSLVVSFFASLVVLVGGVALWLGLRSTVLQRK